MARWQAELQEYDYLIEHISGKENIPADALLCLLDELLAKEDNRDQIVIPSEKFIAGTTLPEPSEEEKRALMMEVHDQPAVGHPGRDETIRKAKQRTTWQGMRTWIEDYVKGCAMCQQNKNSTHKRATPPFKITTTPNA